MQECKCPSQYYLPSEECITSKLPCKAIMQSGKKNYKTPAPENLSTVTLRTQLQVNNKSSRNCGTKQSRKCVCHLKCMAIILRSKSKTTQKLETDILWDSTQCAKMPVPKSIITTPDQYSISNLRRAATTKCNCIQDGRQSSCRASARKLENHGV